MDKDKLTPESCDHDCKWEYHTRMITDLYGNEGSLDEWVCTECNEVVESERTT